MDQASRAYKTMSHVKVKSESLKGCAERCPI